MKTQIVITQERVLDDRPDPSYLEQEGWEQRLAEYRRGDFGYIGIRAVATVKLFNANGCEWAETKIKSSGLWGIEDDSSEEYFEEVFQAERTTLLEMLEQIKDYEIVE